MLVANLLSPLKPSCPDDILGSVCEFAETRDHLCLEACSDLDPGSSCGIRVDVATFQCTKIDKQDIPYSDE